MRMFNSITLACVMAVVAAPLAPAVAHAQDRLANGAPMSFADLIERVSPAVVSIDVEAEQRVARFEGFEEELERLPPPFREFFREFGGPGADGRPRRRLSSGSGFVISEDGYVVTNYHVVADADAVTVSLRDGPEFDARIVGTDPSTDLAVVKVESDEPLPHVEFAKADPRVGDWVVAVGNPFRLGGTATAGIVSATGRELGGQFGNYNDFLQIDAPINPGNSGGPTFDLDGNVVGVNSQISSPTGASVGIGFAIPAEIASDIVARLIDDGRVVRGWLGVQIQSVTEDLAESYGLDDARGAIVGEVIPGSPAEEAGFQPGDVILRINRQTVTDNVDVTRRVGGLEVGEKNRFTILRDGKERQITVTIGERPAPDQEASVGAGRDSNGDGVFGLRLRRADNEDRSRLGLNGGEAALVIVEIARDSEAERRGLRPGEAILEVNGEAATSNRDFRRAVEAAQEAGRGSVRVWVTDGRGRRFVPLRFEDE